MVSSRALEIFLDLTFQRSKGFLTQERRASDSAEDRVQRTVREEYHPTAWGKLLDQQRHCQRWQDRTDEPWQEC